ncbi:MAG: Orotate phosphoribosyltransferase [Candidatus Moanabacter tarae]|uniref:Orotate phosphoribosyltransferase n=1 Tax=Candidatus Moanibacter tarae TaxID=2200854 RepID=A0A2Z4ABD9_9BACT|nr:MAG: Orotate phosphoribosyltransferase [Candidatus Moanabacter tarae]|tara:strand:- start:7343 stop:7756 length:414 start_codon:yes stop_codon:yes gene_type:complete
MEDITFGEISDRLHCASIPEIDEVVGILNGGLVPAALLAHQLCKPLSFLAIRFRDADNKPLYGYPRLMGKPDLLPKKKKVLLVDDVAVTGKTFQKAVEHLQDCRIVTLVLKGKADVVIFPEVEDCVGWPWRRTNFDL